MQQLRYFLLIGGIMLATAMAAFCQGTAAPAAPATPAAPAAPTAPATPATPGTAAPAAQPERGPFQHDAQPEQPTAPAQPVDPDKVDVSISFVKADLSDVLNFLSMASGVPIVVDADVKGTVTIASVYKVKLSLAYDVINSALRVRGYTLVGTLKDKVIRVVPLKRAIAEKPAVLMGANAADIGSSDTVITQVIPVQFLNAGKLRDDLKPLVPDDQANILAVSSTNTLVLTDTEANVKRLVQLINLLDKDNSDVMDVEVYQCKYASATNLINSITQVLGLNASAQTPQQPQPGRPGGPNGAPGAIQTDSGVLSLQGQLHLAADDRTNSIMISAAKPKIAMVMTLVKKLDVNTTSEVQAKVFRLQYADATMVANQLNTLFQQPQGSGSTSGGGNPFFARFATPTTVDDKLYAGLKRNIVVADVRTNSVVVTATEQNMQQFTTMIQELDVQNPLSDVARTFNLKYAKASTLAQTLNRLFTGNSSQQRNNNMNYFFTQTATTQNGDPISSLKNITVVNDDKTNSLLITAPPQAYPMIENMIAQLDRRTDQVYIEVAVVDVTLDNSSQFGIEWKLKSMALAPDGKSPQQTGGPYFGLDQQQYGLKYSVISNSLQALLNGLTSKSNVKVYSTPTITTADNVAAKIAIGQDVPYVTSTQTNSAGNPVQTVAFQNVSVALNVTPHVNVASDLVTLDVDQTINEVVDHVQMLNDAPVIANREAKTTVMVNDGQTIVIGGIIKDNTDKENQGVPLLSKIPLVGELFKSHTNSKQRSELMVFLTPHILRDEASVNAITNRERDKLSDPGPVLQQPKEQPKK